MCRQLLRGGIPGLHFYTLNLEVSAPAILHTLSLIKARGLCSPFLSRSDGQAQDVLSHRDLPFARDKSRKEEGVRPVHWANRPDAYVARTAQWDDFPNGLLLRCRRFLGSRDLCSPSPRPLPTRCCG